MDTASTQTLGYPSIGPGRELKRALESHWAGRSDDHSPVQTLHAVEGLAWQAQAAAGIERIGVGDASLYDSILDWAVRFHAIPERFLRFEGLERYFAMARGAPGVPALELTKWFDTNYHYLVPELGADWEPRLDAGDFLQTIRRAGERLGPRAAPILPGPLTFLRLSRISGLSFDEALARLLPVYAELLAALGRMRFAGQPPAEVQIHEPALVLPWDGPAQERFALAYDNLRGSGPAINLVTYFDDLGDNFAWARDLPVTVLSLDFTRGENLDLLRRHGWPAGKVLGAGVVDGRNVWRVDPDVVQPVLAELRERAQSVRVGPSTSFKFVPHSLEPEEDLPGSLRGVLAFAQEKLHEVAGLGREMHGGDGDDVLGEARRAWRAFRSSTRGDSALRARVERLGSESFRRSLAYTERRPLQVSLPPLPVTTIGSFPQTQDLRRLRRQWRQGSVGEQEYRAGLDREIRRTVAEQDAIGVDIAVHGEFERADMVEYFAERLRGFAVTRFGWVQSYGSRCVRPPILFDDVARPEPLTVREFRVAQAATTRPVKGMLTGPVTVVNWSFVRPDLARRDALYQLGLALRDEISDLEAAGARVIQVDEPALREGLPLRAARRAEYLRHAVAAFRLATGGAAPGTQVHTHMCYAEFDDILEAIDQLDADVISLESARSGGKTLAALARRGYPREVGPGVYDVHSPAVPSVESVEAHLRANLRHLPPEQIWVNPDCGLKTRAWSEVLPSLQNLVAAARKLRQEVKAAEGVKDG